MTSHTKTFALIAVVIVLIVYVSWQPTIADVLSYGGLSNAIGAVRYQVNQYSPISFAIAAPDQTIVVTSGQEVTLGESIDITADAAIIRIIDVPTGYIVYDDTVSVESGSSYFEATLTPPELFDDESARLYITSIQGYRQGTLVSDNGHYLAVVDSSGSEGFTVFTPYKGSTPSLLKGLYNKITPTFNSAYTKVISPVGDTIMAKVMGVEKPSIANGASAVISKKCTNPFHCRDTVVASTAKGIIKKPATATTPQVVVDATPLSTKPKCTAQSSAKVANGVIKETKLCATGGGYSDIVEYLVCNKGYYAIESPANVYLQEGLRTTHRGRNLRLTLATIPEGESLQCRKILNAAQVEAVYAKAAAKAAAEANKAQPSAPKASPEAEEANVDEQPAGDTKPESSAANPAPPKAPTNQPTVPPNDQPKDELIKGIPDTYLIIGLFAIAAFFIAKKRKLI